MSALRRRDGLQEKVRSRMAGVDVLLLPTVPVTAPRLDSRDEPLGAGWTSPRLALLALTSPWSVLGLPAVSVPMPAGPSGLPTAVQLVGHPGEEHRLLRAATLLESGVASRG